MYCISIILFKSMGSDILSANCSKTSIKTLETLLRRKLCALPFCNSERGMDRADCGAWTFLDQYEGLPLGPSPLLSHCGEYVCCRRNHKCSRSQPALGQLDEVPSFCFGLRPLEPLADQPGDWGGDNHHDRTVGSVGSESAKKASKKARRTDRAGNGFLKEHSIIASHSICWHSHAGLSGTAQIKPVHPNQPGVGLVTTKPSDRNTRPAVRDFGRVYGTMVTILSVAVPRQGYLGKVG